MSFALGASSAQSVDDFAIKKRARQILSHISSLGHLDL